MTARRYLSTVGSALDLLDRVDEAERDIAVRVVAKRSVAEGVVVLDLEPRDGRALPRWSPGAHLDLILDHVDTRQYSLCGDPGDPGSYRVAVLRQDEGRGTSRYVHDAVQVGDPLTVRGPRNNFHFERAQSYRFIAGGIGITPILPMVQGAERMDANWSLTYGGRSRASMAFLDELATFAEKVRVCPQDEFGLLDLGALLDTPEPDTLVYCCGPEPLLAAVEAASGAWPSGSVRTERFSPKQTAVPAGDVAFDIELTQSGRTLEVGSDQSILEVVRNAGLTVRSSCLEGTCGTCETRLIAGEADHRDSILTPDEQAAQDCLMICVSRARSSRLVLDL